MEAGRHQATAVKKVARGARLREAYARTLRHSIFVTKLKFSLASVAAALLLLIVIWPLANPDRLGIKFMFDEDSAAVSGEAPGMLKPRLHGVDSKGQPYHIAADKATQEGDTALLLENIAGAIALKDGAKIDISAMQGRYRAEEKKVELRGKVRIATDRGYRFLTEAADVDLEKGEAGGTAPVIIEGPSGTLRADGFTIRDNGNSIHFTGGVKMKLQPEER